MKLLSLLLSLCSVTFAERQTSNEERTATISLQPLLPIPPPPSVLATVSYNPSTLSASLTSFEPPILPDDDSLLRISLSSSQSSTLTSAQTFQKGYRPIFLLSLNAAGDIISVSVKGERIDAGQTRDFGPKIVVKGMELARGPVLNRPVVLKEGKLEGEVVNKTLLQK